MFKNYNIFLILASGLILTGCENRDTPEPKPGPQVTIGLSEDPIFSPEPVSICDRDAGFCADDWGISMEHTREFLGVAAEESFLADAEAAGFDTFDGTRFTFSSGVYCDVNLKTCMEAKDSESPAHNYAAILFPEENP